MKALLLLYLCFTLCACQNTFCPSNEDIKPCTCIMGSDKKPWIYCEGLGSLDELRNAVKGMKDLKLSTLFISKSNIGTFPADIFKDVEIQTLNILYTNLTSLSESLNRPPYLGLEGSLEYIEIKDCFTDETNPLTRLSFAHLKKLVMIQLEGNIIPTIGNNMFESGPYGLKELQLLDTYATTLGNYAFASLINLRKLSLTGGAITEISRKIFPEPATYLEMMELSYNKLSSIPEDLFTKMPSLKEVYLENNDFTTINEISFAPVWGQLSRVTFLGNPLQCDKGMKWIFQYRLPESLQGYCESPPKLKSKSLMNLTINDFK